MHKCTLPKQSLSGLPRLSPHAGCSDRYFRKFKKMFLVSNTHFATKQVFKSTSALFQERKRHLTTSYWFIIHPYSPLSVYIQLIMSVNWLILFICEPILDAFYGLHQRSTSFLFTVTITTIWIHRFFILITFIRGYVIFKTSEVILRPRQIAINYLKGFLLLDFVGVLPVRHTLYILGEKSVIGNIYSFVRRLKALRLITMIKFLKTVTSFIDMDNTKYRVFTFFVLMLYTIHGFTCTFHWLPRKHFSNYENFQEDSWVSVLNLTHTPLHWRYLNSFHYVVSHFLCSGKGEKELYNEREVMLLTVVTIVGYWCMLIGLALVLQMYMSYGASESKYEELLNTLSIYSAKKNLPSLIKQRLFQYYEHKFQRHYFNELDICETLSEHLNYELVLHACSNLIRRVPIFFGLSKMVIGKILACLTQEVYLKNDVVFDSTNQGEYIYFVAYGCIAIFTIDGIEMCHMVDSTFFGAVNILVQEFRDNLTAIAIEPSQLFRLSKSDFLKIYYSHSDFAEKVRRHCEKQIDVFDQALILNTRTGKKFDIMQNIRRGKVLEPNKKRSTVKIDKN